jgi:hypothetical protein
VAFKFRAASGDLSGSPSAREGPAPTIGIRSIVSLYPRIGSGGLVGPSVPGVPGCVARRDLHGFQDLAELDAQYYASVPPTPMVLKGPRGTKLPA